MLPEYINQETLQVFISAAFAEDWGDGDHSSLGSIPSSKTNTAKLLVKDTGIIAGLELSKYLFDYVSKNFSIDYLLKDGAEVKPGMVAFTIEGNSQKILGAERIVLNCMQRMSGIATRTQQLNQLIKGTGARLLDTRKTTPNFRLAEKWAVHIGGGVNHRFGLYDMIMLKDNHIDVAGGVHAALSAIKAYLEKIDKPLKIEIEIRNLRELKEALDFGGFHRILLDNMNVSNLKECVKLINGQYETEASGGITQENIKSIAETGVDFISVGALTHSYKSLDLSLKAVK